MKWSSGSEKKEEWNGLEENEVNPKPGPVLNMNEECPLLSAEKENKRLSTGLLERYSVS